jgi:predicted dienelactone hydrolase
MSRAPLLAVLVAGLTAVAAPARAAEYPVGHSVRQVTVPSLVQPTATRKVDVHLWYPASAADAAIRPKTVYRSALYGRPLGTASTPLSWQVEAEIAREGAAVEPAGKPYPVLVFSHGNTNDPIDYAHTLELIAAGGFIVAAPYHANNTQDDARIDYANSLAGTTPIPCNDGLPSPCSRADVPISMADRNRDVSAVLDALGGWFGARADTVKAGVLGHSRGTLTALAAAGGSAAPIAGSPCQATQPTCWPLQRDPRVQAVMGMAIGQLPITLGVNFKGVTVPTLLVSGGRDLMSPLSVSMRAYMEIASPDKTLVTLDDAVHRTFDSTYCDQVQAAGTVFKADPKALLDKHTFDRIVTSPNSGWAPDYCAFAAFDGITELVTAATDAATPTIAGDGFTPTPANVPRTGLETDAVKRDMAERAIAFFGAKLARVETAGVGGTVPATLALTLAGPASFGAFTPGIDREYVATTTANVVSTAGEAALGVSEPGRLANGAFTLAEPLRVELSRASWSAPVSNDPVTITFRQHVAATQALRTGAYSHTLTFTLSTTAP